MVIFALFFIGCNSSPDGSNKTLDSKTNPKDSIKSYDIKKFISFDNTTTYDEVIKYLNIKHLSYVENPDLLSFNFYERNDFPSSTFWVIDCPFANFIWVPVLDVDELIFTKNLFCFYNNTICFITIIEYPLPSLNYYMHELANLYKKKYGIPIEYSNIVDTFYKPEIHTHSKNMGYENLKDTVNVTFKEYIEKNPDEQMEKYHRDEMTIYFSNYGKLTSKCIEYRDKSEKTKEKEHQIKEKKILDKL